MSDVLASGTLVARRYLVEQPIGKGGMGQVYLVRHARTGERFALKVLHGRPDDLDVRRFRREARAPALIDSDHVVRVIDADVDNGMPFLVMERLRGENLETITARGPIPPEEAILYLRQIARALDKAHLLGIVHRDLKPDNVFLTRREDGTPCVKVLDFGLVKFTGPSADTSAKNTGRGFVAGTPAYMAPEQVVGGAVGSPADVWAFGMLAYRLLTGEDYWAPMPLHRLFQEILRPVRLVPSERARALGPAFERWMGKACASLPTQRFLTLVGAVLRLERALAQPDHVDEDDEEDEATSLYDASQPFLRLDAPAVPRLDTSDTVEDLRVPVWRMRTSVRELVRRWRAPRVPRLGWSLLAVVTVLAVLLAGREWLLGLLHARGSR